MTSQSNPVGHNSAAVVAKKQGVHVVWSTNGGSSASDGDLLGHVQVLQCHQFSPVKSGTGEHKHHKRVPSPECARIVTTNRHQPSEVIRLDRERLRGLGAVETRDFKDSQVFRSGHPSHPV